MQRRYKGSGGGHVGLPFKKQRARVIMHGATRINEHAGLQGMRLMRKKA